MNEFSAVCRILGSLFNRQPQDPLLLPLFSALSTGKLVALWPLAQTTELETLQRHSDDGAVLKTDYERLFTGDGCCVSPYASRWPGGKQENDVRCFLQSLGMPLAAQPADHFGQLLLAASWIEDHVKENTLQKQIMLFDDYLLPWCMEFLGKTEAYANTVFYRTLALMSREGLWAMREELNESMTDMK